jgi:hydroxyacylglutathione hydrolase
MKTHGPLRVEAVFEPAFQANAYVVWTEPEREALIIDPGLPPQDQALAALVNEHELRLRLVLATHCHLDHIAGVSAVCAAFPGVQFCAPRDEEHMLTDAVANLSAPFGFNVLAPPADRLLAPGDSLDLGPLSWTALDVSGHSPGGLAYYSASAGVVFTGDTLIARNIGRYDFPGSSGPRLLTNIRRNLMSLPDETAVYSGHGPPTSIGIEREQNPFLEPDFVP